MAQGRRKDPARSEPRSFSIDSASGLAATTTVWAWKVATGRTLKVERCVLNVGTSITADNTNFWKWELKDGSTVIATWTTAIVAGQGTLTANTPVEMVLNATDANNAAAAGDTLTLVVTKTGTPSALGTFNVHPDGQMY